MKRIEYKGEVAPFSGLRPYRSLQDALDAMSPPGHREVGWSVLAALARAQLRRGASVVLDGVARQAEVDLCRRLAAAEAASLVVVLTTRSDASTHRSRVEGRARGIPNWYELDWPHVERARSTWEAPLGVDLELDAVRSLAENLELLKTVLSAATSSGDLRADPAYLAKVAYADDHLLRDRVSLYDHQQPRIDLVGEVMHRLGKLNTRVVADIGCGNGTYLRALSGAGAVAVGLDLSTGMLRAVPGGPRDLVLSDAQSLPLRTACLDAAIAMHMLYHVPDPALAVREAGRAIRPGGRFITAIGGPGHLREARQLWSGLLREAGLSQELQDLGLTNTRLSVPRLREILQENFSEVRLRWRRAGGLSLSSGAVVPRSSGAPPVKDRGRPDECVLGSVARQEKCSRSQEVAKSTRARASKRWLVDEPTGPERPAPAMRASRPMTAKASSPATTFS
jgi:SAM-dependent methyltransferase